MPRWSVDHITLTCRSIDRIFLQAYVQKLQTVGQVCRFLHRQRGFPIPSSAAFGQIGEAYVAEIHRWAKANGIPVRYFTKEDNKEKIAEPLLRMVEIPKPEGRGVRILGVPTPFCRIRHHAARRWICPTPIHVIGAVQRRWIVTTALGLPLQSWPHSRRSNA